MEDEKKIAIIGAGMSGLLACKHLMEMGFTPTVFESSDCIGGVWSHTIESTKLQTPKSYYSFSDFDWPHSVKQTFPNHNQVLDYFKSYALHFNIIPRIKFNSKVVSIDYQLSPFSSEDHISSWEWWGGTGDPFSAAGKWNVYVQQQGMLVQVYQVDFVILCIGRYSGLANNPEFPINKGPQVFNGEALHSMDYSNMDDEAAAEFTKNKRVVVVGFQKSAIDIAAEIANRNVGPKFPCTLLFRTVHWTVPELFMEHSLKSFNRVSELMLHKPREGFFLWLLAFLLSPLLWIQSKVVEFYLKWRLPLKKYNMVPDHGFFKQIFSCMFTILPNNFYERVSEGSLLLVKSKSFSFCEKGVIITPEKPPIPADIVIFATGYKSTEKLKSIFKSSYFQDSIANSTAPLYRESIHPRIPQLAILGYADSASYLYTTEMRSKWVAHLLAGKFKLPAVREMEAETKDWEKWSRIYAKEDYKSSCTSVKLPIYFNDLLCKDMGLSPRRKNGALSELFGPYLPTDYKHTF
ncbi:Probable flavin-containing monooxygenase 1 [Linum perenne]